MLLVCCRFVVDLLIVCSWFVGLVSMFCLFVCLFVGGMVSVCCGFDVGSLCFCCWFVCWFGVAFLVGLLLVSCLIVVGLLLVGLLVRCCVSLLVWCGFGV